MTIITVAGLEWPKPGKKTGAVIDQSGKKWVVYADKIGQFQQFQTYDIVSKTISFNGRTFDTIESATTGSTGGQPQPGSGLTDPGHLPYKPQPRPTSDDQRRMDIFVCGAFNNMMANQHIDPHELSTPAMIAFISALKAAWKATLGPKADPISSTTNPDMNDEIPF